MPGFPDGNLTFPSFPPPPPSIPCKFRVSWRGGGASDIAHGKGCRLDDDEDEEEAATPPVRQIKNSLSFNYARKSGFIITLTKHVEKGWPAWRQRRNPPIRLNNIVVRRSSRPLYIQPFGWIKKGIKNGIVNSIEETRQFKRLCIYWRSKQRWLGVYLFTKQNKNVPGIPLSFAYRMKLNFYCTICTLRSNVEMNN